MKKKKYGATPRKILSRLSYRLEYESEFWTYLLSKLDMPSFDLSRLKFLTRLMYRLRIFYLLKGIIVSSGRVVNWLSSISLTQIVGAICKPIKWCVNHIELVILFHLAFCSTLLAVLSIVSFLTN